MKGDGTPVPLTPHPRAQAQPEGDALPGAGRLATANAMMFVRALDGGDPTGALQALRWSCRTELPDAVHAFVDHAEAPMLRLLILRAADRLDEIDSLLPVRPG